MFDIITFSTILLMGVIALPVISISLACFGIGRANVMYNNEDYDV